ncbi:MAG: SpoIIE family protein phosphatase [Firmicutes bacterium]|nr:SpoIIE family protein phosphatase [Bacillota bacterium]
MEAKGNVKVKGDFFVRGERRGVFALPKITAGQAGRYAVFFALFTLLWKAEILGGIRPFAFGFYLALAYAGQNVLLLTPLYIAASVLAVPEPATLVVSAATTLALLAVCLFCMRRKIPLTLPMLFIFGLIGQAGYIYVCITNGVRPLSAVLTLVLGLFFMYVCTQLLAAALVKRMHYALNKSELACFCIFTAAVSAGLYNVPVAGILLVRAAFAFSALSLYAVGGGFPFGAALSIGLGVAVGGGDPSCVAAFACMTLIAALFNDLNRYAAAASMLIMDIVFGLYFNAYTEFSLLLLAPIAAGGLVCALLPERYFEFVRSAGCGADGKFAARHIVNRSREQLSRRMRELSDVFREMEQIFSGMVRESLSPEEARSVLAEQMPAVLCAGCQRYGACFAGGAVMTLQAFSDLLYAALRRGKATVVDLPSYLSARCCRTGSLLNEVNRLADGYRGHILSIANANASHVLVGEQLGGVSALFASLAKDTSRGLSFEFERERRLIDELGYLNILCAEAVITAEKNFLNVSLMLKNGSYEAETIKNAVSDVLKSRMSVLTEETSARAGFSLIYLRTAPAYDAALGICGVTKSGEKRSGDSHGFVRIGDDRIMFALCDGMGAGECAERLSAAALSLVENFYRAGFNDDTILSSVNKLLSVGNNETFTTLDICITNLRDGVADFIKIGAPFGFIKKLQTCDTVESNCLPFGVLEEIRPVVHRRALCSGDIVILCTDGVSDVFDSPSDMANMVNAYTGQNPQTLANDIVNYCVQSDKYCPHDDMTVMCARIFAYK